MGTNTKQSDHGAAQEWARRMSRPISKATAHEFRAWVREAPENARLFLIATYQLQRRVESVVAPHAEVVQLSVRTGHPPFFAQQWRTRAAETRFSELLPQILVGVLGTVTVGLLVAFSLGLLSLPAQARLVDAVGAPAVVELAGGTVVTLDPGSRLLIPKSDEERKVRLERGTGLFQVVSAAGRTFWVSFPGGAVETVGTTFKVAAQGTGMEVAVYEGKVLVHGERTDKLVAVSVGASAQVSREGLVTLIPTDTPPAVAARDDPVSVSVLEIAAVYNARHPDRPLIVDPEVQHERILLKLDETDPEQILAALDDLDQFVLEASPRGVLVKPKNRHGSHAIQTER